MDFLKKQGVFSRSFNLQLFMAILLGLLGVVFSILVPLKFKELIDFINSERTVNLSIILFIVSLVVVEITFQIFSGYLLQKLGINLVYQLREKVIAKILRLKKEEIDNFSSGNLASMLTNDTSALFHLISTTLPSFIVSLISVLFMSITLFYLSIQLSVVLLILIPILGPIYFLY